MPAGTPAVLTPSPTAAPEPVRLPAADCFTPGEGGLASPEDFVTAAEAVSALENFVSGGPEEVSLRAESLASSLATGGDVLFEEDWCGLLEALFSEPCGIAPEDQPLTRLRAAAALSPYLLFLQKKTVEHNPIAFVVQFNATLFKKFFRDS